MDQTSPHPALRITRSDMNPRCTVVCVSNNPAVLHSHLVASLQTQTEPHDFVTYDSAAHPAASAAQALNVAAKVARGRLIIFAHQDIDLQSPDFLRQFCDLSETVPDVGIVGVMGVDAASTRKISLVNEIEQGPIGSTYRLRGRAISAPTEVETVDEMLFGVPRDVFAQTTFDEASCPTWDLYAVEYCLSVRERGLKCYVLPVTLRHLSPGKVRAPYYRTLEKVLRKHRSTFDTVFTTCGTWHAAQPVPLQRLCKKMKSAWALLRKHARNRQQQSKVASAVIAGACSLLSLN